VNRFVPALVALLVATTAAAQTATSRPVRRGEVTGAELQLEGALTAMRGGKLRWLLTAYEVVGLDRLRPAPGAELNVLTSLEPGESAAELTADARGRAVVTLDIPEDAPDRFGAVIRVHARRGVTRRFDLTVRTTDPRALSVVAEPVTRAEGEVHVVGRLRREDTRLGIADERITLQAHDGRGPLGPPATVRTDAEGLFLHAFEVPDDVQGNVRVEARSEPDEDGRRVQDTVVVGLRGQPSAPLVVAVQPDAHLVDPRQDVGLTVVVRRPDGRPVEGARVRLGSRPVPLTREEEERDREQQLSITDARGRAVLSWRAPPLQAGYNDTVIQVQAGKAGIGRGAGQARVRVAHARFAARLSIEGAALVPELGGRIHARVVGIDGNAAPAGVTVKLDGPRIGQLEAQTDAAGVATFDAPIGPVRDDDRCGGTASTAVELRVGNSRVQPQQHCLAVDPDGAARVEVRPSIVTPGETFAVTVERRRDAARLPVAIAVLARRGGQLHAIDAGVLPPNEDSVELRAPEDAVGELLIRARPLHGAEQREVRGSMAALWVAPAAPLQATLDFEGGRTRATATLRASGDLRAVGFAVPIDEASALETRLRTMAGILGGGLEDLRTDAPTPSLLAAILATRTPLDAGAPAMLRGRGIEATPRPQNPENLGLLRDPWRASDRFVEGRLALLFRAIEAQIDSAVPQRLDDVAVREGNRWRFNRQLLASLNDGSLGAEGATGLGGEPLTIERLEELDRAFTYDNVARRITRKRLFRLLLALRSYVQSNGLDLDWTAPGDPTLWLERVMHRHTPAGNVQPQFLVDGWGRPFELRQTGRPRFTRVQPVEGYELVSAGPDGRFGNGDDIVDPTARVLPTGSLYAEAVAEDLVVARLRGVELGRATVDVVAGAFSAPRIGIPAPPEDRPQQQRLGTLPPVVRPDPHALLLRRPTEPPPTAAVAAHGEGEAILDLELDAEPRTWGVVALAFRDGVGTVARSGGRAGAPILLDLDLPSRVRVGEPLAIEMHLTNVTEQGGEYALQTEGEGLRIDAEPNVTLPAGETRSMSITLHGEEPGRASARVSVNAGGAPIRSVERRLSIDRGLHPFRRRATALVDATWRVDFDLPDDARDPVTRVVLVTPPALADDPDLGDVRRRDPALVAWSRTLAGRPLGAELRASLLRAQRPDGAVEGDELALSTAAAIVAWAASTDPNEEDGVDDEAQAARARASGRLAGLGAFVGEHGSLRMQSAVLAALATSGVSDLDDRARRTDPVGRTLTNWLPMLRRALRDVPAEPSLLARGAAALLLADPRDGHAHAMLERAIESLEEVPGGQLVTPGETLAGSTQEATVGTLALAIAAHQAGRSELAESLLGGAGRHAADVARAGGEAAFWWLAASAYGAMGLDAPESIEVRVGGRTEQVSLENGIAALPVTLAPGGGTRVVVEPGDAPVLARIESIFGRPFTSRDDGPLTARIEGSVGAVDELAALELMIEAKRAVRIPVLDIQLPAGVDADEQLLRTFEAGSNVRDAERREPGFVRLTLPRLEAEQQVVIPLPLRWRSPSQVRGLAVIAYDGERPPDMTVLPPRDLQVAP